MGARVTGEPGRDRRWGQGGRQSVKTSGQHLPPDSPNSDQAIIVVAVALTRTKPSVVKDLIPQEANVREVEASSFVQRRVFAKGAS